jgi:nucleoside-diphosphate-sugar epimerase
MKFAVTGGAGFVGNNIVKLLVSKGHNVIVIDNLHTGKKENLQEIIEEIEFHNADIRDFSKLESILKNVDGIFHEAALTIVQESFQKEKEYFDVNVKGTENIFKIAKKFKKKVVYASSSSIYGNTKEIPIKENFERKPINPYGQTKLEDEFLAEKYTKEGVSIIGLRYFNIFGKGQTGSYAGVITQFIRKLKENKSPIIFGDGSQIRDFVHVSDIAKANLSAMLSETNSGFFNIGTGIPIKIKDLAKIMIKICEKDFEPIFQNALEGDVERSQSNTELAEKMINWKSEIGLEEGLKEFVSYYS